MTTAIIEHNQGKENTKNKENGNNNSDCTGNNENKLKRRVSASREGNSIGR